MQQSIPVAIKLPGEDQTTRPGELVLTELSTSQRLGRSAGALALTLVITGVAALIPILHFVLAPVAFIAGVAITLSIFSRKRAMVGGTGECPACGKRFELMRSMRALPREDLCTACNRAVIIAPVAEGAPVTRL